jgi:hypothetical protein
MTEQDWYWLTRMKRVKRALERNGIKVFIARTEDDARKKALTLIKKGAAVGLGGSRTVRDIGLLDSLRKGKYELYDQYAPGLNLENSRDVRKKGTHAEYFVSGTNAVTDDGSLTWMPPSTGSETSRHP